MESSGISKAVKLSICWADRAPITIQRQGFFVIYAMEVSLVMTLDGKFVGSSRMADELFPKAYEVAPQESPRYYVNNLGIVGGPHAAEQQPAERPDAGFAVCETKSALPAITIETAVEVSSRYDDGIHRNAELQEPTSNTLNRNVAGELVQKLGAEAAGSFSGVFERSAPSNSKQHRVPTTPLSNVVYLSHSESDQPEPQSTVLDISVAERLSAQRHAEPVSIPGNNETRLLAPLQPHEPGKSQLRERRSLGSDLRIPWARQGDAETELARSNYQAQSLSLAEHNQPAARTSSPKRFGDSVDETGEDKRHSSDARVLGAVATFMQRVTEYVGSSHEDNRETPNPLRQDEIANLDLNSDLENTRPHGDGYGRRPGDSFVENDVQGNLFKGTRDSLWSSKQHEEAEIKISKRSERSSESPGVAEAEEINETHLSENGKVAGANLHPRTDDDNPSQEDLRAEGYSNNPGDPVAMASFGNAELEGELNDINRADEGEQVGTKAASKSDGNSSGDQLPSEPYQDGHGFIVECEEIESESEFNSIKEASSTSVSEQDEEAGVNSNIRSDGHNCFNEHIRRDPVAEDPERAFDFLREIQKAHWLDPCAPEAPASKDDLFESDMELALSIMLNQLERGAD